MQRLAVAAASVLLLLFGCSVQADRFIQMSASMPCYTGIAELELVENDCPALLQPLTNLSTPFEPQFHVPWDCLNSMLVSVEGCVVSLVSQMPMSETLFNFSCSWLQLQGNLVNETHARMSSWLRPSPVARYVLSESDLEVAAADVTNPPRAPGWQAQLAEQIRESSMLVADPTAGLPDHVVLQQFGGQCATTFKVKSGGVMRVGSVNSSSVGMIVLPSAAPFTQPFVIRGQRPNLWAGRARAWIIALGVMVGVFALTLLSCLGLLVYRLVRAGRGQKSSGSSGGGLIVTTPFEDGIARYEVGMGLPPQQEIGQGAVSLEHQARRHGSTGGL